MIYIITILIILYGVFRYDVRGKYNTKLSTWLIVWMALLSGFSYKLGTDILGYMSEFTTYKANFSWSDLVLYAEDRMQPGWVLLNWFCCNLFGDFASLKIIHAIIVNWAVYYFMKKTRVPQFTFLLLYFLLLWFQLNLNILREGLAIAFFLFAVPSLFEWNWKRYYIFVLLAFSMHFGAIVLFVLPLLRLINYRSKLAVYVIVTLLIVLPISLSASGLTDIINTAFDLLEMQTDVYSRAYMSEDTSSERNIIVNLIRIITIVIPIMYTWRYDKLKSNAFMGLALMYVLLYSFSTMIAALHRVMQFFEPVYYVMLVEFILKAPKQYTPKIRLITTTLLLVFYLIPAYNFYFGKDGLGNYRYIYQYPYTTIFNKEDAEFRNAILP